MEASLLPFSDTFTYPFIFPVLKLLFDKKGLPPVPLKKPQRTEFYTPNTRSATITPRQPRCPTSTPGRTYFKPREVFFSQNINLPSKRAPQDTATTPT
jgi:hypothetical protein